MKLSARNQIGGRVVEVRKGATTAHVRIDIGNGTVIVSSITNEAVDHLGPSWTILGSRWAMRLLPSSRRPM